MPRREDVNQRNEFLERISGNYKSRKVYFLTYPLEEELGCKRKEVHDKFPHLMPYWAVRYYSEGGRCFVEIGDGARMNVVLEAKQWNQIIRCIRRHENCDNGNNGKCSLISMLSFGGEIFGDGRAQKLYSLIKEGYLPEVREQI